MVPAVEVGEVKNGTTKAMDCLHNGGLTKDRIKVTGVATGDYICVLCRHEKMANIL